MQMPHTFCPTLSSGELLKQIVNYKKKHTQYVCCVLFPAVLYQGFSGALFAAAANGPISLSHCCDRKIG